MKAKDLFPMKLNTLLAVCVLSSPLAARAAMIDPIQLPRHFGDQWEEKVHSADSKGIPILQFWFKNDEGKIESNVFLDYNGTGTLPSAEIYYVKHWKKELPDIHYRVLGTYYPTGSSGIEPLGPTPTPRGIPLPGAGMLFGSALAAGAMLRGRWKASKSA